MLDGLVTFLDLKVRGEFGGNGPLGEVFEKLLRVMDGLTRLEGLASWLKPWWIISGESLTSLGRLEDIFSRIKSKFSVSAIFL